MSVSNRKYSGTGVSGLFDSVIKEDGIDYFDGYLNPGRRYDVFDRVTRFQKSDIVKDANNMLTQWKNNNVPENQIPGKLVAFFQESIRKRVQSKMSFGSGGVMMFGNTCSSPQPAVDTSFGKKKKNKRASFGKKKKTRKASFGKKNKKKTRA